MFSLCHVAKKTGRQGDHTWYAAAILYEDRLFCQILIWNFDKIAKWSQEGLGEQYVYRCSQCFRFVNDSPPKGFTCLHELEEFNECLKKFLLGSWEASWGSSQSLVRWTIGTVGFRSRSLASRMYVCLWCLYFFCLEERERSWLYICPSMKN